MIRSTSDTRAARRLALQKAFVMGLATVAMAPMALGDSTSYTVQRGDTLYSIAKRLKTTETDLRTANQLDEKTSLKVGQRLILPGTQPATPAPAPVVPTNFTATYRVKAGDSLYRIAVAHGTSQELLAAANDMRTDGVLQIGQTLKVPAGVQAKPTTSVPVAPVPPVVTGAPVEPVAARPQPTAAPAPEPVQTDPVAVRVGNEPVQLRSDNSMNASVLATVQPGVKLTLVGKDGQWWKVLVPGTRQVAYTPGWVVDAVKPGQTEPTLVGSREQAEAVVAKAVAPDKAKADKPAKPVRSALASATITEERVNLRSGPSTQSTRLSMLEHGDNLSILDTQGDWVRVEAEGQTGWVSKDLTSLAPRAEREAKPAADGDAVKTTSGSGLGSRMVAEARKYLGTPYVRGGTSRRGLDCSGLIIAVTREFGLKLPRTAAAQYGNGQRVDRGNLQPGDLVFFKNTYRRGISHVGFYVGDGRFIHASRAGRPVAHASLDDSYYRAHWAGAYRLSK